MELIQAQERRCTGNEPLSRQLLQVAGTVLLDVEITVKLIVQGKVSRASSLWCINIYVTGPNVCCQETHYNAFAIGIDEVSSVVHVDRPG